MPAKLTIEIARARFAAKGHELLETIYISNATKMRYKCRCGAICFIALSKLDSGRDACIPCYTEKRKQTNLKTYGVENPLQSPEVQEKVRQTNIERYGAEYPLQSKSVQEARKLYYLENFGETLFIQRTQFVQERR